MTSQANIAVREEADRPYENSILVIQGEYKVSSDPHACLSTLLGSCIAVCLSDTVAGVGGMNHFLLPAAGGGLDSNTTKYGANSMELLINGLLKRGAQRGRLEAKVFGGARLMNGLSDIGEKNAEFAMDFLKRENIPCLSESTGGVQARRIKYWPTSGRARQLMVPPSVDIEELKKPPLPPAPAPADDDIEFF